MSFPMLKKLCSRSCATLFIGFSTGITTYLPGNYGRNISSFLYMTKQVRRKSIRTCNVLGLSFLGQCPRIQKCNLSGMPFGGSSKSDLRHKNRTVLFYITGATVLVGGLSYAAVPLYRIYCQSTGKGGKAVIAAASEKIEQMEKVRHRQISVHFNADISSGMMWDFKPQQRHIKVVPGETALAFYTATNPTDVPIIGISTYNVLPFEAGLYFNKIQCFCFEEQMLSPHEQVDMPVFFYIDPEFAEDPRLEDVDSIVLSYTFFEAKKGLKLPVPTIR